MVKFKGHLNFDLEKDCGDNESDPVQSGSASVRKERAPASANKYRVSKTNEGFIRKMTTQETIDGGKRPAILDTQKPKFRLRSSLRSSYFHREHTRPRPKVTSQDGEERENKMAYKSEAKDRVPCAIQNKLNQQLDGLSQIERDLRQL